jgi:hypothetical protein
MSCETRAQSDRRVLPQSGLRRKTWLDERSNYQEEINEKGLWVAQSSRLKAHGS